MSNFKVIIDMNRCVDEIMPKIGASAWMVFCYLALQPPPASITTMLPMDQRQIDRALSELVFAGYVVRTSAGYAIAERWRLEA